MYIVHIYRYFLVDRKAIDELRKFLSVSNLSMLVGKGVVYAIRG